MPEGHARLHAIVRGRVHGVGFRDFVLHRATSLQLTGVVRNLPDGVVEVIAEGPRGASKRLLDELRKGPRMSHVDRIDQAWTEATGAHARFSIR